jgi:hypothetical protein
LYPEKGDDATLVVDCQKSRRSGWEIVEVQVATWIFARHFDPESRESIGSLPANW